MITKFVLSADIGQMHDYTAIGVLQVVGGSKYNLVTLKKLPLRTSYPDVVAEIKRMYDSLVKQVGAGQVELVTDVTGVGRPVLDMLKAAGLEPMAVTITGGAEATNEGMEYHIPKRDLVAACQVLMQQRRLEVAQGVTAMQDFVRELENFKYKINISTGNDTYNAWRESIHDDLVLCVCLGCWVLERPSRVVSASAGGQRSGISALPIPSLKGQVLPSPLGIGGRPGFRQPGSMPSYIDKPGYRGPAGPATKRQY